MEAEDDHVHTNDDTSEIQSYSVCLDLGYTKSIHFQPQNESLKQKTFLIYIGGKRTFADRWLSAFH